LKNKILFWLDAGLKQFTIAKFLQEKYNADYYGIYDLNHHLKKSFENQKFVNFQKVWYYWDNYQKSLAKPDIEYLVNFEKKYKIDLWILAYGERLFYKYNPFYKFKRAEILSILERDCKFFEGILDEIKPDFLVIKVTDFHRNHLLAEICKVKGIKVLMTMPTRFGFRATIGSDLQKRDETWNTSVKNENNFNSFTELREYLKKYNRYKQTSQAKSGGLDYSIWKKIIPSIKWMLKTFDKEYRQGYDHYGITRSSVIYVKILLDLKRRFRKKFLDNNSIKNIKNNEKFVFFPLQVEPERTIVYDAPFFANQLEMIKNIAKALPIDIKLYVKEHYNMRFRSWREVQFYKDLLRLPNVRLIHPSVNPEEILEKCSIVITTSSTAAMEAAFYEKSSIVFTDTVYSDLPSVYRIKDLEELPEMINKALKTKVNLKDVNEFINLVERNSFDFDDFGFTNEILEKFHRGGFLINEEIDLKEFNLFLDKKRESFSELIQKHIEIIEEASKQEKALGSIKEKTNVVKLRSVKKEDWELILEIRNDKTVRNACHDTSIISFEQHVKYMEKINDDSNSYQWIVTCDEKDVGHAKIIGEEFGYMISEQYRNRGIGTKIYELVFKEAKKHGIKRLHDTIKIDQQIPLRVALKMGFIQNDIIKKDGKPYAYSLDKKL